jgi:hypothetical protein
MSTESLTYGDLANRLGTTQEAARSLARRLRLPRMKGNDGKARVNVDLNDFQYKPMPSRKRDGHRADDTVEALQTELARIEVEKRCLEATAAGHRADFERERDRAESALAEALKMTSVAMSARETAARLEGELLARRRSWWRRRIASNSGSQKEAALDAVSPRSAQTEPEAMTIRRRLPLGRTLLLELIALTLVAAVAFLFVQHGVPYFAEP